MTTLQELRTLADEQEKFYEAMIKIEQKPQGIDIRCERPHCPFHLSYQEEETPEGNYTLSKAITSHEHGSADDPFFQTFLAKKELITFKP
jgi:hypothetical protein